MRAPRIQQFADLTVPLDQAVAAGGGTMTFASDGDAIHWRQRVYKYRKRLQEAYGRSPYDALVMPRIEPGSATVIIEVRQAKGLFTPGLDDPLDAAALAISRKLGI